MRIRNPAAYQASIERSRRELERAADDRLAEAIAPGRRLDAEGLRWSVRVRSTELGDVDATASIDGVVDVRASVRRAGRALHAPDLIAEVRAQLVSAIELRADRLLEVADRIRLSRGAT